MEQALTSPVFLSILYACAFFFYQWRRKMKDISPSSILSSAVSGIILAAFASFLAITNTEFAKQCGNPTEYGCSVASLFVSTSITSLIALILWFIASITAQGR
jgi:hypothetical protein